jgi:murein DD-endopeptidase MepM/ murein hydrolase activator NlpD
MKKVLLSIALAVVSISEGVARQNPPAMAVTHYARSLQPGEVVLLTVSGVQDLRKLEAVAFGKHFPCSSTAEKNWECLVGIDLETKPGAYTVAVQGQGAGTASVHTEYRLNVKPKVFPERRLSVDEKFVTPPPETLERIRKESERVREAMAPVSPERLWDGPFRVPVPGEPISSFGKRSILNGKPRSPHAGTDFRGATGVPVKAPNRGRVVLAGDLYFSGNTVILDHGQGLYSYFAHLSKITVTEGDIVEEGVVVGNVGATGRVTGPHLHWSIRLSETRIDPLSLIAIGVRPR